MSKDQIPAEDILRIVNAPDGAVVVAVHPAPYTHLLSRGCTKDATDQFRIATAGAAVKHANTRHTPCVATTGSPS